MTLEYSLLCSQEPATGPSSVPDESSLHPIYLLKANLNIVFPCTDILN